MVSIRRLYRIARYSFASADALAYIGILDIKNLGDEAVYSAVKGCFAPHPVYPYISPNRPKKLHDKIASKKLKGAILGGGTLIGAGSKTGNPCLDAFENVAEKYPFHIVFGTGVSGVDFIGDENEPKQMLERWRYLLESARYVGVRGPDSADTLKGYGIEAEVIGDPACQFALESSQWRADSRRVGINIGKSDIEFLNLYEQMARLISRQRAAGYRVEFFVVWPDDLDPTLNTARMADIQHPVIHKIYHNPERFVRVAKTMKAFIGLKLHSVILAMCAGVPSILLEYNPKCRDFMKSVHQEKYNLPVYDITNGMLQSRLEELMENGKKISFQIMSEMKGFKILQLHRAQSIIHSIS